MLAPESLRQQHINEIKRQMDVYQLEPSTKPFDEPDDQLLGQLFGGQ